ncbi:MAG: triose-phosphate isomerase [Candidatus Eremiobacteraeota bacterium]|nr:triose-phosphate isomerase [Candidatus Eremiobacteraeota bacterium]
MRTPLLAGNWKLHKTVREAKELVEELHRAIGKLYEREVVVCPPFTALQAVSSILDGKTIKLGAQDLFWEEKGAYTGEVAPLMLKDVGCTYVIIGHSERRKYFSETDEWVNRKAKAALEAGLIPIICVGESLAQREEGKTVDVVTTQVQAALKDLTASQVERVVIAYEPIWAIGTGKNDSPVEAQKTVSTIRNVMAAQAGDESAGKVRILYGGSVKPDNIDSFMKERDIDGALVGGASLTCESFSRIVKYEA